MSIFFDHNPDTGVTETFDYDPVLDQVMITTSQEVSGFLDRMNEIRKNPDISAKGIRENWWAYCSIPPVVELELRNKGLRLEDKNDMKAILREINTNYPFLKYTDKSHR
jgi:hypothetical protein